jgi:hypothetical protein
MIDFNKYPKLLTFTDAIKIYEGNKPSRHNPGSLRCPPNDKTLWPLLATGQDNGFCVFQTEEIGMDALRTKIYNICMGSSKTYNREAKRLFNLSSCADLTISQCFQIYAPSTDFNNPFKYASFVAAKVGIREIDKISILLDRFDQKLEDILPVPPVVPTLPEIQKEINLIQRFLNWLLSRARH